MLPKSLTLAFLAAAAAADRLKPVTPVTPAGADPLQKRQSCGIAQEECGAGCIPLGWTCCPDGLGGCGILETCVMGSNDEYGCCPVGRRCVGEGGVTTIGGGGGGGGDLPTPTDDDDFPLPTSTGGSSVDDDDDDLDFGGSDDDDDDLDFGDDNDDDVTTPSTTASAEAAPTFAPGGGDNAPSDGDGGDSSATRNALSFAGALAAAVLAF